VPSELLENDALFDAEGVAVDSHGNVFEAGRLDGNIVEFFGGAEAESVVLGVTGGGNPIALRSIATTTCSCATRRATPC
jgi:hypothetical protein